ncbi:DUF3750 domain-containing protein [Thalassomonas haliotis]|uniref:DUF3750 domain-containing protein n=1 Tax=Thalassomonas haliotis TaxID=485448 RepID=A0ABY7VKR9_9GAMM|nr:DUF3750 domain-containing protein [Thalassomonas haliotis]WDE14058.1 DUF3750 domain-containing protein [Thalassomonas haliotis]
MTGITEKTAASVELRAARIPGIVGIIADHYWFVIDKGGEEKVKQRWEVWQNKDAGGQSWHYLHKNLKDWQSGVGNGPSRLEYCWYGLEAQSLIEAIETSPSQYPYVPCYRYWPGPNSNTYVQWVLDQARITEIPGPSAIGKDYLGLIGSKVSRQGLLFSTPVVGAAFSRGKYVIFQLMTLPFGWSMKPFRLLYPGLRLQQNKNR